MGSMGSTTSPCRFPSTKIPALRFSALLGESTPKVELALCVVGRQDR